MVVPCNSTCNGNDSCNGNVKKITVWQSITCIIIITVVVNTVIIDISSTTSKFKYSDNVHLFCVDVNHI